MPVNNKARTVLYAVYFFVISLYLISAPPFICLVTVICAAMHEASHLLCAKLLGRRVSPLRMGVTGIYPDVGCGSALSCILIYAAGPLFNMLVCIFCLAFFKFFSYNDKMFEIFCANAALFCFNILPVPYSDGDGIVRTAFSFFLCSRIADFLCASLNLIFSFMLFVFFSYRFFIFGGGFFSFFCSFVFMIASVSRFGKG